MNALVLEGGGSKGALHVGAYSAFLEENIEFEAIVGTSIGAINAAMIVQGDFDKLRMIWENDLTTESLFGIQNSLISSILNIKLSPQILQDAGKHVSEIIKGGGIDPKPIRTLLEENISEEKIRSSKIDFGLVTFSLSDKKTLYLLKQDIPEGEMLDYILASANLPVFKSNKNAQKKFLDGGMFDNYPVSLAAKEGVTKIYVVRTASLGFHPSFNADGIDVVHIHPSDSTLPLMEFDTEEAKNSIRLGYFDTMRVLRNLSGTRYYIDASEITAKSAFQGISSIPGECAKSMSAVFDLEYVDLNRTMFEFVWPYFIKNFKLKKTDTYKDMLISIVDLAAESLQIDRFRFFTVLELLDEVKAALASEKSSELKRLHRKVIAARLICKHMDLSFIKDA